LQKILSKFWAFYVSFLSFKTNWILYVLNNRVSLLFFSNSRNNTFTRQKHIFFKYLRYNVFFVHCLFHYKSNLDRGSVEEGYGTAIKNPCHIVNICAHLRRLFEYKKIYLCQNDNQKFSRSRKRIKSEKSWKMIKPTRIREREIQIQTAKMQIYIRANKSYVTHFDCHNCLSATLMINNKSIAKGKT